MNTKSKISNNEDNSFLLKDIPDKFTDYVFDTNAVLAGLSKSLGLDLPATLFVANQVVVRYGLFAPFQYALRRAREKGNINDEYFSTAKAR